MATNVIHISEAEAAKDFPGLLARVREGAEVVIESEGNQWRFCRRQVFPTLAWRND